MDITSFVLGLTCGKKGGGSAGGGGGNSGGGGDASLNIAYGYTAPTDKSKLWVKDSAPNKVIVSSTLTPHEDSRKTQSTIAKGSFYVNYFYMGASACGTKIYIFGGIEVSSGLQNTIYCFDSITETISTLPTTLPYKCCGISCATVGTNIYLFGARTSRYPTAQDQTVYNDIWVFDTINQTIRVRGASEALANQTPISGQCCVAIGEKIYLFGGYLPEHKQYVNYILIFNASTEKYEYSYYDLPKALYDCYCVAIGTKIYISSGKPSSGINYAIFCLDTVTGDITTLPTSLPEDQYIYRVMGTAVGKLYFFGGYVGNYSEYPSSDIYCYDLESNEIVKEIVMLNSGVSFGQAVTVGNDIFIFGSQGGNGRQIKKFLAPVNDIALASGDLQIIPTADINTFPIVNSETVFVEIGAGKVYKGNAEGKAEQVEAALYKDGAWSNI